jgi:hypothetical protein
MRFARRGRFCRVHVRRIGLTAESGRAVCAGAACSCSLSLSALEALSGVASSWPDVRRSSHRKEKSGDTTTTVATTSSLVTNTRLNWLKQKRGITRPS